MSKSSPSALYDLFQNGDIPNASAFQDLIDTPLWLAASGQPAIQTTASLQAGSGISLTQTGSVIKIDMATGGSAFSIAASGQVGLTSTASLQAGSNVSLSYAASVITINATAAPFQISASTATTLTTTACFQAGSLLTIAQTGSVIKYDIFAREVLSASRIYYVRTDGNDSNLGLTNSAASAWLTIQHAFDEVAKLDFSTFSVNIQCDDATRTATNSIKAWVGSGSLVLIGNVSSPSSNIISVTGGNCIENSTAALSGKFLIKGFELRTITSGVEILVSQPGGIQFESVRLGATAWHHLSAVGGGREITATGSYVISGNAGLSHVDVSSGATVRIESVAVALSGSPSWGNGFANAWRCGIGLFYAASFSGLSTGKRYDVTKNGVIDTFGGGSAFLPGNAAGTASTGGQYT